MSLYQLRQLFMISVHHSPLVWPRASFPPGVAPCIIPPGVAPCIFPPGVAPCIIPPGVAPFLSVRNGIQEKLKLRCVSRVFLHYVPKHSNRNIYQYINISIPVTPERAARHIQIQHIKIHTEYWKLLLGGGYRRVITLWVWALSAMDFFMGSAFICSGNSKKVFKYV